MQGNKQIFVSACLSFLLMISSNEHNFDAKYLKHGKFVDIFA